MLATLDNGKQIDLVFSNVDLPSLKNGPAIVNDILTHIPHRRILLTSGNAANQFSNENFHPKIVKFIPKPFEIKILSKEYEKFYLTILKRASFFVYKLHFHALI